MSHRSDDAGSVVVHVVSYDVSRGAEQYARALVDVLNARGTARHLLLTLFVGDEEGLGADVSLDVPRGVLRRAGFDPRAAFGLRRAVSRLGPVALVAHGGEPAKYLAFAAGGVPYVYLMIGSSHPLMRRRISRFLRRLYVGRAAALVAVSNELAEEVRDESGIDNGRLRVIPNGRDPAQYRPRSSMGADIPRVLFVGHLDDQKRPLLFVDVVHQVSSRGVGCRAAIVGSGPLLETVTIEARRAGIEVLGSRDDVPELLAAADLLVLTSRPPEGLPGVLIEAGLCGLPVVTTDVPGAREVVEDGVTGLIVDIDDEEGLVEAVASLLADEARRATMGREARTRCVNKFSLDTSADLWQELLERVSA